MRKTIYSAFSSSVEGTTQPVLSQAEVDQINADIASITDDGILSASEKSKTFVPTVTELDQLSSALIAKAATLSIDSSALTTAKDTFTSYLTGLTPAWDNESLDTQVNRITLNSNLSSYTAEIANLQTEIQGQPGPAGANALQSTIIYAYRRSASAPVGPDASTTYTFSTKTLSGTLGNSWTTTIPAGSDPLYVVAATASSTAPTDTDTILSTDWSSPVLFVQDGAIGTAGINSASVFLYQRSLSTPVVPSVTTTYTFSSGDLSGENNGWTQTIPTGSNPLWITIATASANTATDTILTGEWSTPSVLAESGTAGALNTGWRTNSLLNWYTGPTGTQVAIASGGIYSIRENVDAPVGNTAIRIIDDSLVTARQFFGDQVPIDPNKIYKISLWARQPVGDELNYLCLATLDGNRVNITANTSDSSGWTGTLSRGTYHYFRVINAVFPASYTYYEVTVGPNGEATWPSNTKFASIGALHNGDGSVLSTVDISQYKIEEITDAAAALASALAAQATADGKITTFYQTAAPTAEAVGDLWVDTDSSPVTAYRWSGSAWQQVATLGSSWAQVVGTGKPEDNADVTGDNTAAAIVGQGSFATISTLTAKLLSDSGITTGQNIIIDPQFKDTNYWIQAGAPTVTMSWSTDATALAQLKASTRVPKWTGTNVTNDGTADYPMVEVNVGIPVPIGKKRVFVRFEIYVEVADTAGENILVFQIRCKKQDGTFAYPSFTVPASTFNTTGLKSIQGVVTLDNATVEIEPNYQFAVNPLVACNGIFYCGPAYAVFISELGSELFREDGATVVTDNTAITALGTAAAITGQGALATLNTVTATQIADGSISTPKLSSNQISALFATIGTLSSAASPNARTVIKDDVIEVYDSNNVLRVKIGNLA